MSEWISVKDRLPEPNTAVLVCRDGYYGSEVAVAVYKDEYLKFITGYNVTHWMPLPEPPESEEKKEDKDNG